MWGGLCLFFVFSGYKKKDDSDELDCKFGASMEYNIKKTTENLKMKIVPDITEHAALNGSSFDASLTTEAAQWLQTLRQTWLACMLCGKRNKNQNSRQKCANIAFYLIVFQTRKA